MLPNGHHKPNDVDICKAFTTINQYSVFSCVLMVFMTFEYSLVKLNKAEKFFANNFVSVFSCVSVKNGSFRYF